VIGFPRRIWPEVRAGTGFGALLYPVMVFGVGIVVNLLLQAITGRSVSSPRQLPAHLSAAGVAISIAYGVVIAPVHEELFFRGILFRSLADRYGFATGALLAGTAMNSLGTLPPGNLSLERDADVPVAPGGRERGYPKPDNERVFDKLSSVYLSGNRTRDDAPSHIRVDRKVRREVAEAWRHMCPAQVYELAGEASPAGNVVDVEVTASNCIQCGAISAKGGRLTPPEGGDGPEYSLM